MKKIFLAVLLVSVILVSGCIQETEIDKDKLKDLIGETIDGAPFDETALKYKENEIRACESKCPSRKCSVKVVTSGFFEKIKSLKIECAPSSNQQDGWGFLPNYSYTPEPSKESLNALVPPQPGVITVPSPSPQLPSPSPKVEFEKFDCGSLIYRLPGGYALKANSNQPLSGAFQGSQQTLDKQYPGTDSYGGSYAGTCQLYVIVPVDPDGGDNYGVITLHYFNKEDELKSEIERLFGRAIKDSIEDGYGAGKHDGKGTYDENVGGYSYFTPADPKKVTTFSVDYGYRVGMCLFYGRMLNDYSDSLTEIEKFKDSSLTFVEAVRNNQNFIDFCKT